MWGNILTEVSYLNNFNMTFSNSKSDVLIHLTQWQYWWWFWFTFLWVLYYLLTARIVRYRTLKFNPKIATTLRPHGKWGDLLTCIIPVTWCLNILLNSNFVLKLIEWQSESSLFTLRVRAKQWYWVYKFDLKNITDVLSAPKNLGRNKWHFSIFGDVQVSEDYLHILQLRSQNKWIKKYWSDLLDKTTKTKDFHLISPQERFKADLYRSQHIIHNDSIHPYYTDSDLFSYTNNESIKTINDYFTDLSLIPYDTVIKDDLTDDYLPFISNNSLNSLNDLIEEDLEFFADDLFKTLTGANPHPSEELTKPKFDVFDFFCEDTYEAYNNYYKSLLEKMRKDIKATTNRITTDSFIQSPQYFEFFTERSVDDFFKNLLNNSLFYLSGDSNTTLPHYQINTGLYNFLNSDTKKLSLKDLTNFKVINYSDFGDETRILKKNVGKHNPLRLIKLPLNEHNHLVHDTTELIRFRFNSPNSIIKHKPTSNATYLTLKQKRYNVRNKINPLKFNSIVDGKKYSYSGNPFLKDVSIIQENFSNPTKQYRMFKKARSRLDTTSISTWNRLLRAKRVLVLPAHVNITAITNSYDIIHSWHIPGLGLKMDCLPGRATHHTFYIDNVGLYFGQCAEICGRYHHHMPIRVCALPFEHFLIWWYSFGLPRLLFLREKNYKEYSFRKFSW